MHGRRFDMAAAIPHGDTPYNTFDYMSNKFTDPTEENMFQEWFKFHAKKRGLNPDPNAGEHHYDYRAAYKAGVAPSPDGHWDSRFKSAGHPDLIVQADVPGQLMNSKTGERMWNPKYHDVPMDQLFNLEKRPPMIAKPRRTR
jgi:hypothetical protein